MSRPRTIEDEDIKTAARGVFVEHGPSASVKLVAERLGVSHAALFSRAGSKQQLMLDSLCPGIPSAMEQLRQGPPDAEVLPRLEEILSELMAFFRRVVPNLVVLRAAGCSMDDLPMPRQAAPPPVAIRAALAQWLQRALAADRLEPCDPAQVAEGLLGAMEARCFNGYIGGPSFAPGSDDRFVRELVRGLLAQVAP